MSKAFARWTVMGCLLATVVLFNFASPQGATGLVAGYAFSEGAGASTADASGNGLAGTLVNGPAWVNGKFGKALSFNGSSTYVNLGNPSALQMTGSMTLSAWVFETANVADDGQIVAKSDGASGWQLKSSKDTGPRTFGIAITNAAGAPVQRYSQTVRALNTWYHVAGVYDATARTLNIYVNGILNNGVLSGTVPSSRLNSTVNANIGRRTGGFTIAGVVDDVRIYNRALTQSEIQSDMAVGADGGVVPSSDFSLTTGGNKSVARGGSVTNSITASLIAGPATTVSFSASGMPSGMTAAFAPASCQATCSSTLTLTAAASTPIGTSTITVTGSGGGVTRTTTFTVSVTAAADTTRPTVSLSAPANGATVLGVSVSLTAIASDNVGISGVQFLLDGANLNAEDTASPYSTTWNTTATTSGPHTVSARARDAAGNTATAASVNVTVDNQAPTGTVSINGGAAATNSRNATLTLSATDALSAVTQMRFSNTGTSYSTADAYAPAKAWTLTTGAGTKTVYVQFKDAPGNWSAAATSTIVVDTTAPTISSVTTSNVTQNSALVKWTTSEPATSQVDYGTTTAYGQSTAIDNTLTLSHSVTVTGLGPSTTYNYRARSMDAATNLRLGTNNTFRTLSGPDTTPPTAPGNVSAVATSPVAVSVSWNASSDNVGVTRYSVVRDHVEIATPSASPYADNSVARGTTYTYSVFARDAAGNTSASSLPASVTTPALMFSSIATESITARTANITWTTDIPATSRIEYGPTAQYGSATSEDTALVVNHSQVLTGLTQGTLYHFRVAGADASGLNDASSDQVFSTATSGQSGVFQNEVLITGMNLPSAVKFLPNGNMLVLELGGNIWTVNAGSTQVNAAAFLTLTNIGTLNGQQGLMDLVLDPDFATNGYYYVFYTLGSPNRDRVSRFTATADRTGTVPASEFVVYQDPQDANAEHHGGALNFGNDGKLYVTIGEHFDPPAAQSLTTSHGKILRINSDGTVPADNPFYDGAGPNVDSIWALGLRNPFRAFYDAPTGRLYVGDVGGNDYSTAQEEVNLGVRGANYGWPVCEGSSCGADPTYTSPIYAYAHDGRDASITGGFIYRGNQFPAQYYGNYFFADYAQNWIKRLTFDANGAVSGVFNFEPLDGTPDGPYGDIVSLAQGPDGALYYVDLGYSDVTGQTGISKIRRIRFVSTDAPPLATASADPGEGLEPLTVQFSSAGSSDPEGETLSYSWDFGDDTTSTDPDPVHTFARRGRYVVRLSVSDGINTSLAAPINISVGNRPSASVLSPFDGTLFRAGDTITFSGDGTDLEDGALPASAFTWNIDFLHEGHVHPGLPATGVKSGTFVIPTAGHDFSGNTRYRITLTVTDSDGLQSSQSVVVYPEKVTVSFDSVPTGLQISLDGIPNTTPFAHDTLIGFNHTIDAPNQIQGQSSYTFSGWSDSGAQQHVFVVPSAFTSLVASFTASQNPLPPGLVAGYRFSEGTGTVSADISGNNTTGTLVGNPAWTAAGKYGNGLNFSATSYADLGNPTTLRLTGSMTLSAWIKISANPFDDAAIVGKFASGGWVLKTSADTGVRTAAIQISSNGVNSIQRYSQTALVANTWYHIAGVYDATARTLNVYVNGVLDNGVLSGTVPSAQFDPSANVNIAQRTSDPGTFNFVGTLDEVHIFNRALTAAQIQTDMNTPR